MRGRRYGSFDDDRMTRQSDRDRRMSAPSQKSDEMLFVGTNKLHWTTHPRQRRELGAGLVHSHVLGMLGGVFLVLRRLHMPSHPARQGFSISLFIHSETGSNRRYTVPLLLVDGGSHGMRSSVSLNARVSAELFASIRTSMEDPSLCIYNGRLKPQACEVLSFLPCWTPSPYLPLTGLTA